MSKAMQAVCLLVATFALILALVVLRAFVLTQLWGWFVVPLGAPSIGIAHAIGISFVASLFLIGLKTDVPDSDEDDGVWVKVFRPLAKAAFACLFAWGMGAIVHGFM